MRTRMTVALACTLVWGLFPEVFAGPSPEPPADVTCRLDNGAGTFEASSGPGGTEVRIKGAAGSYTGNATITFGAGAATPRLKFHFAGLRTLETFTLTTGKYSFQGQLGWGAGRTVKHFDKTGRQVSGPALAALTLVMEPTKAGDVEISISTNRDVELGKELKVNWLLQSLKQRKGAGK